MREAGFEGIRKAITRGKNTVAQYITTRPILDLCEKATQRKGARVSRKWWDQEWIDLETAKEMASESTTTDSESEAESEAELQNSTERAFEAYGKALETVSTFKYLGRVMTAVDDNWPSVAGNLVKSQKSWGRLSWILSREGANNRVSGNFFKAVVQAVLLFGAETWVLTLSIERALDNFLHGDACGITGRKPQRGGSGQWTYPYLKEAMREAGFEGIRKGHHKEVEYGRARRWCRPCYCLGRRHGYLPQG